MCLPIESSQVAAVDADQEIFLIDVQDDAALLRSTNLCDAHGPIEKWRLGVGYTRQASFSDFLWGLNGLG